MLDHISTAQYSSLYWDAKLGQWEALGEESGYTIKNKYGTKVLDMSDKERKLLRSDAKGTIMGAVIGFTFGLGHPVAIIGNAIGQGARESLQTAIGMEFGWW